MSGSFLFVSSMEGQQGWLRIYRFRKYLGEGGERELGRGSLKVFEILGPLKA